MPTRDLIRKLFIFAAIFLAGGIVGIAIGTHWHVYRDHANMQLRLGGYTYINPLLECEVDGNQIEFREFTPFSERVETLIRKKTADRTYMQVAVYFRDLNNGAWFGIGEDYKFAPASMLKVPNVIALLKQAEVSPSFLKTRVTYTGKEDLNTREMYRPPDAMLPGKAYMMTATTS